ncbi:MAG TPA: insulinase family protein [candidate division Zixibacteria bacterium]|nr:insulinase family protein [candidate division Zixibacteria bacterium]
MFISLIRDPLSFSVPGYGEFLIAHTPCLTNSVIHIIIPFASSDRSYFTVAHLLEHLLLRENAHATDKKLGSMIEQLGGTIQATTSTDHTLFKCLIPTEFENQAIRTLQSGLFQLKINSFELDEEKDVILYESEKITLHSSLELQMEYILCGYSNIDYAADYIANLHNINIDTVIDFHNNFYSPAKTYWVIVSPSSPGQLCESLGGKAVSMKKLKTYLDNRAIYRHKTYIVNIPQRQPEFLLVLPLVRSTAWDEAVIDLFSSILKDLITLDHSKEHFRGWSLNKCLVRWWERQILFGLYVSSKSERLIENVKGIISYLHFCITRTFDEDLLNNHKRRLLLDLEVTCEHPDGLASLLSVNWFRTRDPYRLLEYVSALQQIDTESFSNTLKYVLQPRRLIAAGVVSEAATINQIESILDEFRLLQNGIFTEHASSIIVRDFCHKNEIENYEAAYKPFIKNVIAVETLDNGSRFCALRTRHSSIAAICWTLYSSGEKTIDTAFSLLIQMALTKVIRDNFSLKRMPLEDINCTYFHDHICFSILTAEEDLNEWCTAMAQALLLPSFDVESIWRISAIIMEHEPQNNTLFVEYFMDNLNHRLYEQRFKVPSSLEFGATLRSSWIDRLMSLIRWSLDPAHIVISVGSRSNPNVMIERMAPLCEKGKLELRELKDDLSRISPISNIHLRSTSNNIISQAVGIYSLPIGHPQLGALSILTHLIAHNGGLLIKTLTDRGCTLLAGGVESYNYLYSGALLTHVITKAHYADTARSAINSMLDKIASGKIAKDEWERAFLLARSLESGVPLSTLESTRYLGRCILCGLTPEAILHSDISGVSPEEVINLASFMFSEDRRIWMLGLEGED